MKKTLMGIIGIALIVTGITIIILFNFQGLVITNPYENVDWESYGQYKTALHVHTFNSDGRASTDYTVDYHYSQGYNFVAATDHNYNTNKWSEVENGAMASDREEEIMRGEGRDHKPIFPIPYSTEQSLEDHVNTFFANFVNEEGMTLEDNIKKAEEIGGISHINHPGRYTGGQEGGEEGENASNNADNIQKYVDLFMKYPSCTGMEIINKLDNESRSDRILWDNILMKTMPSGRNVWGYSNDDSHSLEEIGYSFNVMLLNKNEFAQNGTAALYAATDDEIKAQSENNPVRKAMENGAFYAVSRVDRRENINADAPPAGTYSTLDLLEQPTPSISNIQTDTEQGTITITGADYDIIEWIADGVKISEGNTLNLKDNKDKINHYYVRAQLKSKTGIAFTQPFGIKF